MSPAIMIQFCCLSVAPPFYRSNCLGYLNETAMPSTKVAVIAEVNPSGPPEFAASLFLELDIFLFVNLFERFFLWRFVCFIYWFGV